MTPINAISIIKGGTTKEEIPDALVDIALWFENEETDCLPPKQAVAELIAHNIILSGRFDAEILTPAFFTLGKLVTEGCAVTTIACAQTLLPRKAEEVVMRNALIAIENHLDDPLARLPIISSKDTIQFLMNLIGEYSSGPHDRALPERVKKQLIDLKSL